MPAGPAPFSRQTLGDTEVTLPSSGDQLCAQGGNPGGALETDPDPSRATYFFVQCSRGTGDKGESHWREVTQVWITSPLGPSTEITDVFKSH